MQARRSRGKLVIRILATLLRPRAIVVRHAHASVEVVHVALRWNDLRQIAGDEISVLVTAGSTNDGAADFRSGVVQDAVRIDGIGGVGRATIHLVGLVLLHNQIVARRNGQRATIAPPHVVAPARKRGRAGQADLGSESVASARWRDTLSKTAGKVRITAGSSRQPRRRAPGIALHQTLALRLSVCLQFDVGWRATGVGRRGAIRRSHAWATVSIGDSESLATLVDRNLATLCGVGIEDNGVRVRVIALESLPDLTRTAGLKTAAARPHPRIVAIANPVVIVPRLGRGLRLRGPTATAHLHIVDGGAAGVVLAKQWSALVQQPLRTIRHPLRGNWGGATGPHHCRTPGGCAALLRILEESLGHVGERQGIRRGVETGHGLPLATTLLRIGIAIARLLAGGSGGSRRATALHPQRAGVQCGVVATTHKRIRAICAHNPLSAAILRAITVLLCCCSCRYADIASLLGLGRGRNGADQIERAQKVT